MRVVSALAPYAQDAVITGHDRDEIGVLLFPSAAAAQLAPQDLAARVATALKALRADGACDEPAPPA